MPVVVLEPFRRNILPIETSAVDEAGDVSVVDPDKETLGVFPDPLPDPVPRRFVPAVTDSLYPALASRSAGSTFRTVWTIAEGLLSSRQKLISSICTHRPETDFRVAQATVVDISMVRRNGIVFIEGLELFSFLANVGDSKSLVVHPATVTHGHLTEEEQLLAGVKPEQIRLSLSVEDAEDQLWDLDQAFSKAKG